MQPIPVQQIGTIGTPLTFEDDGVNLRKPISSDHNTVGKVSVRSEPELSFKKSDIEGSQKPETLQPQDQDREDKPESPVAEEEKKETDDLIVEDLTINQIKAKLVQEYKESKRNDKGEIDDDVDRPLRRRLRPNANLELGIKF